MSKGTDEAAGYILDIEWDVPDLPGLVGPFDTKDDARIWAGINIPNGSWMVCPLVAPYAKSSRERAAVSR